MKADGNPLTMSKLQAVDLGAQRPHSSSSNPLVQKAAQLQQQNTLAAAERGNPVKRPHSNNTHDRSYWEVPSINSDITKEIEQLINAGSESTNAQATRAAPIRLQAPAAVQVAPVVTTESTKKRQTFNLAAQNMLNTNLAPPDVSPIYAMHNEEPQNKFDEGALTRALGAPLTTYEDSLI